MRNYFLRGSKRQKTFSIIYHQIKENKPYSWKMLSRKIFSFIIEFSVKQTQSPFVSWKTTFEKIFFKFSTVRFMKKWTSCGIIFRQDKKVFLRGENVFHFSNYEKYFPYSLLSHNLLTPFFLIFFFNNLNFQFFFFFL